ncbi:MAG: helix-turn-helix domain-containing protein [Pleurocapsa sp. MO_192.B19]|nr:helix-turn-helix domain-containing protein [Pleurocapsa sp. MO_192.B19]
MTKRTSQGDETSSPPVSSKVALSQLKRMPQPNIGLLIKQLRQEMEQTQEEFASECGVVFSTVNRWEKGHRKPSPMALKLIVLMLSSLEERGQELFQKYQT